MKRICPYIRILFISLTIFSIFFITSIHDSSYALSDEEYRQFMSESQEYRDAENRLNGIWKQLMEKLDETGKADLKKSQRNWIQHERDSSAKIISGQRGINLVSAYALVTEQRADVLEQLLKPKKAKSQEQMPVQDKKQSKPADPVSAPKKAEPGKPDILKNILKDKNGGLIFMVSGGILLFIAWVCWQKRKQSEGDEYAQKIMRDIGGGSIGKQVKAHVSAGIYGLMALLIGLAGLGLLINGLNLYK